MAGNTRGKIKEHMEGVHRNYDWVIDHCNKILVLVNDPEHPLYDPILALAEATQRLDTAACELYSGL